jgi:transcriptional regulator with XRE-family HTH domain
MDAEPASLDQQIGERIRLRRTELGLTQDQLAAALGVSYQQVQKYENGANRISAVRLWQIGRRLEVPVGWFFDEADAEAGAGAAAAPLVHVRGVLEVARGFGELRSAPVKTALVSLLRTLADRRI